MALRRVSDQFCLYEYSLVMQRPYLLRSYSLKESFVVAKSIDVIFAQGVGLENFALHKIIFIHVFVRITSSLPIPLLALKLPWQRLRRNPLQSVVNTPSKIHQEKQAPTPLAIFSRRDFRSLQHVIEVMFFGQIV